MSVSEQLQKHYGTLERNQSILRLYHQFGVPQAEIARQLKLTRQAVNQIIQRSKKAGK